MSTKQVVPIYRDGRHYDALNSFLVADIPFYVEEARRADAYEPPPSRKKRGKDGCPSVGTSLRDWTAHHSDRTECDGDRRARLVSVDAGACA